MPDKHYFVEDFSGSEYEKIRNYKPNLFKKHLTEIIIVLIIILVFLIGIYKNYSDIQDNEVIRCLSQNCTIYISSLCPHCDKQLKELGKNIMDFKVVDCLVSPQECTKINSLPTIICNNKTFTGIKKLNELKELIC